MPTISTGLKSLDVLRINNSEELVGVIDDVIKKNPEMGFFDASPISKNEYNTLVIDKYPKVGFRKPGEFAEHEVAKLSNRTVKCAYLDASWTMDKALASQTDWGKERALAIQTMTHLQSAFFTLSQQIWYGVRNEANGFQGLHDLVGQANQELFLDAGGTGGNLTSVYAVSTGLDSIQLAWGSDGKLTEGDVQEQWITNLSDPKNGGAWHYAQDISGWAGLQVTSAHAFGRIAHLSDSATLTDDLLYDLLSKFPAGRKPQAFFLTRRAMNQLRKSRTAVNATGAPAPTPTEVGGVPLIETDAIMDNEETLAE